MRELRQLLIVLLLAAFVAGCGGGTKPGTYSASGAIKDAEENPIEAVVLHFSGGHGTAQTDVQGQWVKSGLIGDVTVTPAKDGYTFDPPTQVVSPSFARQVIFVGEPTSLEIYPTSVTLQVDGTQEFTVKGRDKYGQPVAVNAGWIVTGGIGIASPSQGADTLFTATTPGEGTVAAEVDDMVVYAIVKVIPRKEEAEIDVTHEIEATPYDGAGGTVTATFDDDAYVFGDTVTLTATPYPGWRFVGWEGDVQSPESTIELAVIDPDFAPANPFGVAMGGNGTRIIWQWPPMPDITYHPEIMAYGDSLEGLDGTREQAGELLLDKFASRPIRAVFEKEY